LNIVIIIDESGSMYSSHSKMMADVIDRVGSLPKNTVLSVGRFSSINQFGWIVRGASCHNAPQIQATLKNHRPAFNLTCFSQILADTETLLEELATFSPNYSFLFLTDGNDNQDESKVLQILARIAPRVSVATIIGYSDWCDPKRLGDMAMAVGGSFVYANDIEDWRGLFQKFTETIGAAKPKIAITLDSTPDFNVAFTLTNGTVELVEVQPENLMVLVSEAADAVYYFKSQRTQGLVLRNGLHDDPWNGPMYGAAAALLQSGHKGDAMDVIGALGDVKIATTVGNAFTVSEEGLAQTAILDAVYNPVARFRGGREIGCVPKADAFCLIDLLDELIMDDDVALVPYDKSFFYKKTTRGSKTLPGYPKFEEDKVPVPLNKLVWAGEKLNVSMRIEKGGNISVGEDANKFGLDTVHKTKQWRAYSVIADGKLNILKLPLTNVSPKLMALLEKHDLIESKGETVVVVNLTRLPIINRKIAEGYRDLDKLCSYVSEEGDLEAKQKVYNYLFAQLPAALRDRVESLVRGIEYTDAQMQYLAQYGIKKDLSFDPPSEPEPTTDVKIVTTIKIDIKGIASLPAVEEVLEKVKAGEELTARQQVIADAHAAYLALVKKKKMADHQKAVWLREQITEIRQQLAKIRGYINRARFAVALGNSTFIQKPKLDAKTEYVFNGVTYEIKVNRNVKVKI
jgi:hypothetical protein